MPVGADPGFEKKKKSIKSAFHGRNIFFNFPNYCLVNPEFELKDTLNQIEAADLVLADLSYERPSCYYELGLAQALGKKIILVALDGTDIHQACDRNKIEYYKNNDELVKLISCKI